MAPAETIAQNLKGSIRQKTKKDDEAQYSSNLEASLRKYGLGICPEELRVPDFKEFFFKKAAKTSVNRRRPSNRVQGSVS
jgi:hypothetical protein